MGKVFHFIRPSSEHPIVSRGGEFSVVVKGDGVLAERHVSPAIAARFINEMLWLDELFGVENFGSENLNRKLWR